MEIIGIAISIVALILSVFTYFKHDIKIKQQERLLNEYQLTKIETEKADSQKAIIEANVIQVKDGKDKIKVYNKGRSTARNVTVTIPDVEGFKVIHNPCPIDIRPQNGIEIVVLLFTNYPDKVKIDFEWDDDFKDKNRDSQLIQLV
jgi:hypothetical protein